MRCCSSAAAALAVDRASIWIFDDDRRAIVCQDLYEFGRHRHTSGFKLTPADNPEYFTALERDEMIAATDAHQHPSTRMLSKGYLEPYGIGAMLDVPIRVAGKLMGVLCHEHVGGPRLFLADEQTTARLLAHLAYVGKLMRDPDRHTKAFRKVIADPAGHLNGLRVELKDGRTLEVGSRPQIVDGNIIGRVWTVRELTGE